MRSALFPVFFLLSLLPLHAQHVDTELEVVPEPRRSTARGKIPPMFWKVRLNQEISLIPISEIESFGVQEYTVDNLAYVRELTVALKSRTFIRFYHIEARETPSETVNDVIGKVDARVKEIHRDAVGPNGQRLFPVIKTHPITTHKEMMEYRVNHQESINALYEHLEKTFIDYHATRLIEDQRKETIREVKIDSKE